MTWCYLPVYQEDSNTLERSYSLCEVYLDNAGAVANWTETDAIAPRGNDHEDLIGELDNMRRDAARWEPVPYSTLCVGLVLTAKG